MFFLPIGYELDIGLNIHTNILIVNILYLLHNL